MKLNKTLIVLLAIFMLTISAGAAFADDVATTDDDNNEEDVNEDTLDDDAEDDDTETYDEENETDDTEEGELEEEINPVDDTDGVEMLTSSTYEEPVNTTGSANASASGASEASSSPNLANNTAGNPIVILLAAIAGVGLTSIKLRK